MIWLNNNENNILRKYGDITLSLQHHKKVLNIFP